MFQPWSLIKPSDNDRRFTGSDWELPSFNILAQAFLLTEQWWHSTTTDIHGLAHSNAAIADFVLRQWLDTVAPERRIDALCELNVIEQALNACQTTVVQDAWGRGQSLTVHGWFYGLANGLLQDLKMTVSGSAEMTETYDRAIGAVQARYAADARD